jgi:hypothetical protein
VYCFGTGSSSQDETITATLAAITRSPLFITEGVGSGGWFGGHGLPDTPTGHTPGNKNVVSGLFFGVGTDFNVDSAMTEIAAFAQRGQKVNLCGWSRGAVTCFKIANEMAAMGNVEVNIFAFDPVPGDAKGNKHMWQNLSLGANVNDCVIILAQHERRKEFHAAVPSLRNPRFVVDVMPGTHRSILQKTENMGACYKVNLDRCAKFLRTHGTRLDYDKWLPDSKILSLYAKMLRKWGHYQAAGVAEGKWRKWGSADRIIKGFDRDEIGRLTPSSPLGSSRNVWAQKLPFFINGHHAQLFRLKYPRVHDLLRLGQTPLGWQGELQTLILSDPDTADLVFQHFELIGFTG